MERTAVTEEEIKQLAYTIWEREGRPHGKDVEHYFRAKAILEGSTITKGNGQSEPAPHPVAAGAVMESAPEAQSAPRKRASSRSRARKQPG